MQVAAGPQRLSRASGLPWYASVRYRRAQHDLALVAAVVRYVAHLVVHDAECRPSPPGARVAQRMAISASRLADRAPVLASGQRDDQAGLDMP